MGIPKCIILSGVFASGGIYPLKGVASDFSCEKYLSRIMPFPYRQVLPYTCGPACIHSQLLARYISSPGEGKIAKRTRTNEKEGTRVEAMVDVLHSFGLKAHFRESMTLLEIKTGLTKGKGYIVNIQSEGEGHWANVAFVTQNHIILMDPLQGDYSGSYSHSDFLSIWYGGPTQPTVRLAIEIE